MKKFFEWLYHYKTNDIYPVMFSVGLILLSVAVVTTLGLLVDPAVAICLVILLMIGFPVLVYLTKDK